MNKQVVKIGIIGGGNMGSCLVGGMILQHHAPENILVAEKHREKRTLLENKWSISTTDNNQEVARIADILLLAVKPQSMRTLVEEIAPVINPIKTLVISISAGITTAQIQHWANPASFNIVRAMPNTPALFGCGITGLFAAENISTTLMQQAENLLQTVGETVWIKEESLMDVVTALSGSGPAYFFYFMESLINSAVSLGLPAEVASKLTLNTALGSAVMALNSPDNIEKLREKVTSKGGTTEQGIKVLNDGKIQDLLLKTVTAAALRGKTLSEQFD